MRSIRGRRWARLKKKCSFDARKVYRAHPCARLRDPVLWLTQIHQNPLWACVHRRCGDKAEGKAANARVHQPHLCVMGPPPHLPNVIGFQRPALSRPAARLGARQPGTKPACRPGRALFAASSSNDPFHPRILKTQPAPPGTPTTSTTSTTSSAERSCRPSHPQTANPTQPSCRIGNSRGTCRPSSRHGYASSSSLGVRAHGAITQTARDTAAEGRDEIRQGDSNARAVQRQASPSRSPKGHKAGQ